MCVQLNLSLISLAHGILILALVTSNPAIGYAKSVIISIGGGGKSARPVYLVRLLFLSPLRLFLILSPK